MVWFQDDAVTIPPRWSECQCNQCAPLLMPMRVAAERLHVITEEGHRAQEHLKWSPPLSVVDDQNQGTIHTLSTVFLFFWV